MEPLGILTPLENKYPKGSDVVVYSRKDEKELAMEGTKQMGYNPVHFQPIDGDPVLEILIPKGSFTCEQKINVQWNPCPYSCCQAWNDSLYYPVVNPAAGGSAKPYFCGKYEGETAEELRRKKHLFP